MSAVEGPDEGGVQNPPPGDPALLLRPITLPVDELLQAAAPVAGIQNLAHGKCRLAINEPGGWRGWGRREQWADEDRLKQGDVKAWVDPQRVGQLETDGHGDDHSLNHKGTNILR